MNQPGDNICPGRIISVTFRNTELNGSRRITAVYITVSLAAPGQTSAQSLHSRARVNTCLTFPAASFKPWRSWHTWTPAASFTCRGRTIGRYCGGSTMNTSVAGALMSRQCPLPFDRTPTDAPRPASHSGRGRSLVLTGPNIIQQPWSSVCVCVCGVNSPPPFFYDGKDSLAFSHYQNDVTIFKFHVFYIIFFLEFIDSF